MGQEQQGGATEVFARELPTRIIAVVGFLQKILFLNADTMETVMSIATESNNECVARFASASEVDDSIVVGENNLSSSSVWVYHSRPVERDLKMSNLSARRKMKCFHPGVVAVDSFVTAGRKSIIASGDNPLRGQGQLFLSDGLTGGVVHQYDESIMPKWVYALKGVRPWNELIVAGAYSSDIYRYDLTTGSLLSRLPLATPAWGLDFTCKDYDDDDDPSHHGDHDLIFSIAGLTGEEEGSRLGTQTRPDASLKVWSRDDQPRRQVMSFRLSHSLGTAVLAAPESHLVLCGVAGGTIDVFDIRAGSSSSSSEDESESGGSVKGLVTSLTPHRPKGPRGVMLTGVHSVSRVRGKPGVFCSTGDDGTVASWDVDGKVLGRMETGGIAFRCHCSLQHEPRARVRGGGSGETTGAPSLFGLAFTGNAKTLPEREPPSTVFRPVSKTGGPAGVAIAIAAAATTSRSETTPLVKPGHKEGEDDGRMLDFLSQIGLKDSYDTFVKADLKYDQLPELLQYEDAMREICPNPISRLRLSRHIKLTFKIGQTSADDVVSTPEKPKEKCLLARDHIHLGSFIGGGATGDVFSGSLRVGVGLLPVAIKIVPFRKAARSVIMKEVKLLSGLSHESVLGVYGCWFDEFASWIVCELCTQGDLSKRMKGMDLRKRLSVLLSIAEGMRYLHENGIVHRDLKPENVLLSASGNPKVCDFGTSKRKQSVRGTLVGTVGYIPDPEWGWSPESHDVYSFGILSFEVLSGTQAYSKIREELRDELAILREIFRRKIFPDANILVPLVGKDVATLVASCWSDKTVSFERIVAVLRAKLEK